MAAIRPIYLGVNVDHVATIRRARGTAFPDPVEMALQAEEAGADGITMHLREDRRHVVDADLERMAGCTRTKLNMEMAATDEMRDIALRIRPADACIVPERRAELTTEGGLDVVRHRARIADLVAAFNDAGIRTSLFIDPHQRQIEASREAGAPVIELHTGGYAEAAGAANDPASTRRELEALSAAARYAGELGLVVNAGHGLHYANTRAVAALPEINELNIGHAIVARALAVGFARAVGEMKRLICDARGRQGEG
ncbi:MAG: pyridoxine 5'-phosphate synthase [Gammaproteobacteria bacterium]|nr:pyridoxine 5'-phosphate synthase [Gammaproteobacteria bacterium]